MGGFNDTLEALEQSLSVDLRSQRSVRSGGLIERMTYQFSFDISLVLIQFDSYFPGKHVLRFDRSYSCIQHCQFWSESHWVDFSCSKFPVPEASIVQNQPARLDGGIPNMANLANLRPTWQVLISMDLPWTWAGSVREISAMKLCHDFWVHVYDLLHISGFHVYNQHYHIIYI